MGRIHTKALEAAIVAFQAPLPDMEGCDENAVTLYRMIRALVAAKNTEIELGLLVVPQ